MELIAHRKCSVIYTLSTDTTTAQFCRSVPNVRQNLSLDTLSTSFQGPTWKAPREFKQVTQTEEWEQGVHLCEILFLQHLGEAHFL